MAQHDFNIANQGFPAFRSDLNDVLTAINTSQSGTSAPSGAVAGTVWLDTTSATTPTLKFFDGTDHISMCTFDYTANTVNWLDNTVTANLVDDTTPQLGGQLDVNGNSLGDGTLELLSFTEVASAVNEFTISNNATGSDPILSATGGDTNVGMDFTTKGTGLIKFNDLAYYPQQAVTSTTNAVAWDVQAKPNAYHLTTENTTISAPTNAVEGAFICIEIVYGGVHTLAWNTIFEFAASTAPTATSVASQADILTFRYNGSIWQEMGRTLNMAIT